MERNGKPVKQFFSHPVVSSVLKLTVTAVLLVGLFYYIDLEEIIVSLSRANGVYLSVGGALVLANTGIHFLRWRYLLRLLSKEIGNNEVITSLLVGYTAGFFTPAQIGEFVGRVASHPDLKKSHIVGMTIIDKLYILAATLLTGISSLSLFMIQHYAAYWNSVYSALAILILLIVLALFLFPERTQSYLQFLPEKIRMHKLYDVISIIETTFKNRHGRIVLLLSTTLYGIIALQFYVFLTAFETVSFFDSAIGSLSVYFIKAVVLPISIGDLGVRESASVFFFSHYGVSAAAAFNASLCMFLTNILFPSIVGALMVLRLKIK